jgi:hypothetical protein
MRLRRSRLSKKQEERNLRRAVLYIFLTLGLASILIFVGIPVLIRTAIFLGNLRSSANLPEQGDTIPPSPPRLVVPFEATNSASFSLKGYTEPDVKIKLSNSGLSFGEVLADNQGLFSMENLKLTLGRNEITAVAIDSAGNESLPSIPAVIDYDTTPPDLTINQPTEGETISGPENKIMIEGQTEEGAKLTINDRLVIVGPEGKFSNEYPLNQGENHFTLVAQDKAGNQTTEELKVTYSP